MRWGIAFALMFVGVAAQATTVRHTELADLVAQSQIVVRAHVAYVDEYAGTDKFQTRVGFEVDEAVKGVDEATLELMLPGGKGGAYRMHIPGMPTFSPGEEVILLVSRKAGGDVITGLGEGVFRVSRTGAEPRVTQPFVGDAHLVDARGLALRSTAIETTLVDLMSRLHAFARPVVK
jgi:hypothetical protein